MALPDLFLRRSARQGMRGFPIPQKQLYENGWVEFASLREVICQNWTLVESD